jgi:ATP-dependent DNA helicase RecG
LENLMDRTELEGLLDDLRRLGRDTFRVEVKRSRGGVPSTLHETLSAFANGEGGTVLLGVDEKAAFAVTGLGDPGPMLDRVVGILPVD